MKKLILLPLVILFILPQLLMTLMHKAARHHGLLQKVTTPKLVTLISPHLIFISIQKSVSTFFSKPESGFRNPHYPLNTKIITGAITNMRNSTGTITSPGKNIMENQTAKAKAIMVMEKEMVKRTERHIQPDYYFTCWVLIIIH